MKNQGLSMNQLVGLDEKAAKAMITQAGLVVRIRARNGQSFMGTCDVNNRRVNLTIEDDKVTEAHIG